MPTPAEKLEGSVLDGGWVVGAPIERIGAQTGGHFSCSYIVRDKDGNVAFLKAMDYASAFSSPDPAKAINAMTSAYLFEREILQECQERRMSRVVKAVAAGKFNSDGSSPVEYLIFEMADGDIRAFLDFTKRFDLSWTLRCIHDVLLGMGQLNQARIAHQDLKPSNVLVFEEEGSKIADLGRAWHGFRFSPYDELACAGDQTYAAPELLYGFTSSNDLERRYGNDFYLAGSLILFLFTGLRATALLLSKLAPAHHPTNWKGDYHEVLPYLQHAFEEVLQDVQDSIGSSLLGTELRSVLAQMCHPDILQRGAKGFQAKHGSRFDYQRLISQFDRIRAQVRIGRIA